MGEPQALVAHGLRGKEKDEVLVRVVDMYFVAVHC
jgi:hypothetical protein